jgi:hypothetical protein
MRRCALLVWTLVLVMTCNSQHERKQPQLDEESLHQAYRALAEQIRQEVHSRGGDVDKQRVHWVLSFSTGHFAADPTAAQAARYLAKKLVEDLAKARDSVSAYAWEMDVWDHLPGAPRTVIVQSKSPRDMELINKLWPRTPRRDTVGGHDTERAIVEITRALGSVSDAVLVLFTPTAASVAAPNTKVLGQNHPDYQSVLEHWDRVQGATAPPGASKQIQYRVIKPSGEIVNRTMDLVVLVPKQFISVSSIEAPQTVTATDVPTAIRKTRSIFPLILLIVAVLVIPVVWFARNLRNLLFMTPLIEINSHAFFLKRNEGIIIAGTDAITVPEGWHKIVLPGRDVPKRELAKIRKEGTRIVMQAIDCNIRHEGIIYKQLPLKSDGLTQLELYGNEETRPGLPEQEWNVPLTIEIRRERG